MKIWQGAPGCVRAVVCAAVALVAAGSEAATIDVPAGGNLQAAINSARPGDVIRLAPGATFTGNFILPVHGGTTFITIRSASSDALLPGPGVRMTPAYGPYLPRIVSSNQSPALRTAPGAAFWRLQFLEVGPTGRPGTEVISLGDGSGAQTTPAQAAHHLILDRLYVHGDPLVGQKRGIGLNSGETTIANSYVSDMKAVGLDAQAIAGWNGPGPYRIENNYLEASANVILIGGDDPKIPNLVPADILVRGNTITRPVAWRSPIIPTPANVQAIATAGGSLPPGTYAYRVVARRNVGTGTGTSAASADVVVTVASGQSATVSWSPVANAADYVVYGRAPGAQTLSWITTATSLTDAGQGGIAAAPPKKGTVWGVKNLFELKNARRVQVDFNLMENNWAQGQSGVAVLFTPRNQYGGCPWCVVENVVFESNVVRHMGAGISLMGIDYLHPSLQAHDIVIRNNEFSDYSKTWGGNGYFMQMSDRPRDVVIDHNTLISGSGAGIVLVTGPPVTGFVFTNNVAKHDAWGFAGDGKGIDNPAIAHYLPNSIILKNVIAGGRASTFPAGNDFPLLDDFTAHFVDPAAGDYALRPGTNWEGAGTDAKDLGATLPRFRAARAPTTADPPTVVTEVLPPATEGDFYEVAIVAQGGLLPDPWRLAAGAPPQGILLDPLTGVLRGVAIGVGDVAFTVEVVDASGATARQPLSLRVNRLIPPISILTTTLPDATVALPFSQQLIATGGLGMGTYDWRVASGDLPAGISLERSGLITGTPASQGQFTFEVAARDIDNPSREGSRALTLTVSGPPNRPPTILLRPITSGTSLPVGSIVSVRAYATDPDGVVQRIDFYVDGVMAASVASASGRFSWGVLPGTHRVHAVAVDNRGGSTSSPSITFVGR